MTRPIVVTLLAYPKAWTPGTSGVVPRQVYSCHHRRQKGFEKYKGKLAGMIV